VPLSQDGTFADPVSVRARSGTSRDRPGRHRLRRCHQRGWGPADPHRPERAGGCSRRIGLGPGVSSIRRSADHTAARACCSGSRSGCRTPHRHRGRHEMEFVLVGPDGSALPSHMWAQYAWQECSSRGVRRTSWTARAPVSPRTVHPEYGVNQFGSRCPHSHRLRQPTIGAMRIIIGRMARGMGCASAFRPCHLPGSVDRFSPHFSMKRGDHCTVLRRNGSWQA